jgi:hypothetical protein
MNNQDKSFVLLSAVIRPTKLFRPDFSSRLSDGFHTRVSVNRQGVVCCRDFEVVHYLFVIF